MADEDLSWQLRCPACNEMAVFDRAQIIARLDRRGILRRDRKPSTDLLCELLKSAAAAWRCSACQQVGLIVAPVEPLDDEDWGMDRRCQRCGQVIPAERLEVFPDAQICATCKQMEQDRPVEDEPQYCPRCGSIMELKPSRGPGISRYEMRCPDCRR